jgi:hypothetical protein
MLRCYALPMELQLNDDEGTVLTDVLARALGSLREEVYQTTTFEVREQLKRREAIIDALLAKLRAPA